MKFILIIAFLTTFPHGGSQGVALQEFDSEKACRAAGARAVELVRSFHDADEKQVVFDCKPK